MTAFPGVGDAMPDIAMTAADGSAVKPSDFAGRKLVVFFYPKDDTPGCTTENKDFSALKAEFEAAGTKLLGVSKDPAKKHAKFIAKHGLTAPLATDAEEGGLRIGPGALGRLEQLHDGADHVEDGDHRRLVPALQAGGQQDSLE